MATAVGIFVAIAVVVGHHVREKPDDDPDELQNKSTKPQSRAHMDSDPRALLVFLRL